MSLLPAQSLLAASDGATDPGVERLGKIAVQDGGRIMPLEGYARRLAVDVTNRSRWSSKGPEGFTGEPSMTLLLDAMFKSRETLNRKNITIEDKPLKRELGLDPERRFFSAVELANTVKLNEMLNRIESARSESPNYSPTKLERKAMSVRSAVNRLANLGNGEMLAIIPGAPGEAFRFASAQGGQPGTEGVQAALAAIGAEYAAGRPIGAKVEELEKAIADLGTLTPAEAQRVRYELFYDSHHPYRKAAMFYTMALIFFGVSTLVLRKPAIALAIVAGSVGAIEHIMGIGLRVAILERAPVSNTYEALLWMGLVAIALGGVAQLLNKGKGYYLFGGIAAAVISVLFAELVPLTDRTNSLPAVLRSNYWLIIHVMTIVASYGVLAVAAVLGHAYLIKDVILNRRDPVATRRSAALVVQTYRTIQVGLFLLTAGTILGGVWAAESWGRFWGWDPKETWALISILVYFAVLHARYIGWLKDFGLAAAAVLGLVVIVWTFYGVNYVMATGLHSYGFGSGGEVYVGLWAALEMVFLAVCFVRYRMIGPAPTMAREATAKMPANSAQPSA